MIPIDIKDILYCLSFRDLPSLHSMTEDLMQNAMKFLKSMFLTA
jgi:hypothetical protein